MNRLSGRRLATAALTLCATLGVSACADSHPGNAGHATPAANAGLHRSLPASVRQRGEIRVLTDASYAPASSFAPDGRTIVGFEPDLGAALGRLLGVRVVFTNADFAKLPAELASGKGDLIMSAMTDTADREKQLDFVDYFSAGTSLVVQRGNPHGITDLSSLCGETVAVESATTQATLLAEEQAHCGAHRMNVLTEPTNDDAVLQVRIGRAAAVPLDFPPADVLTTDPRTRPNYQLASTVQYEPGLYGIGVLKANRELRDTVQAALSTLMSDGTYHAVLKKWHVLGGAILQIAIDGGA